MNPVKRRRQQRARAGADANPIADGVLHNWALGRLPRPAKAKAANLSQSAWDVTTTPTAILNNRPNRRYFLIQNLSTSASTVFVSFGQSGNGFELPAGASMEIKNPCFRDTVYVVCASGTARVIFAEG